MIKASVISDRYSPETFEKAVQEFLESHKGINITRITNINPGFGYTVLVLYKEVNEEQN